MKITLNSKECTEKNIKKWKFKPALHKGVTVSTWQEQKISFGSSDGVQYEKF